MKYVFSMSLFASFVLAFYFALRFFFTREMKYIENRLAAAFCLSSAIWSVGFGVLILQTDPYMAYICRSIGMVGTIMYMIFAQMLVCHISKVSKTWRNCLEGISFTGIFVYFLATRRDQVVYWLDDMGMTYTFKPGFCNNVYMCYIIIVALNILGVVIYMIRFSTVKRIQAFGKKFLLVEVLLLFGMILDTTFPLIGKAAIPGSTITQFWGMVVLYYAVHMINRSRINITNMSEFIYYSLAMPVLVYDEDRRIQIMNDAAVSFLGIDREVLGTKNVSRLFEIKEEEIFAFEEKRKDVDAVCRENQIYCSLAVSKINDSYGDVIGYIIIVTDLSERIKIVQKLEDAIQEVESANQAKSTFLANMSHEIRTPMNAIIGFSELVLKMELEPQVREYVADIKSASHNLLAIINDILDISKIESGNMELVCGDYYVSGLFNDVFLIISTQAKKKGLDFSMVVDPDIPNKLYGDKIRIRGVLINLLNNAVKYTKQGIVSCEAKAIDKKNDFITLQFQVKDTGVGIKPEEQDSLFESFSQVDRKVHYGEEGTGLGLAIVKGYVTLMGGSVTVDSVYGEGSVFTVIIKQKIVDDTPLDKSYNQENEAVDDFSIGSMKIFGIRALVVDDNRVNLKVAGSNLKYYGLEVDTASSGQEAIEACRKNRYQLVFMDQMMPQMDGIEAMKQIRNIDSYYAVGGKCKIIVLTANAVSGVRLHLLEEGFDEYLGKPMNYKQLERLFVRFLPKENMQISLEENAPKENSDVYKELKEMLPQVEISQGISNCGGHMEDYLKILQMIYSDGQRNVQELENLLSQQNYTDYTIKIHALKGAAFNMGAKQIGDMASRLEKAGKTGDYAFIDAHMKEFQGEYHLLLTKIQQVLEHYQMLKETENMNEKENLKEEEILKLFNDVRQRIVEFDFAGASGLLREIRGYQMSVPYRDATEKISGWMDEMNVDKILKMIEQLEKKGKLLEE